MTYSDFTIATDISLVAWLVQNYEKASQLLLIVCAIGVAEQFA